MADVGTAAPNDNGDDIEADVDRPGPAMTEPDGREAPEPRLLRVVDGLGRLAPSIRATRLDLAEDEQRPPASDDVDLATLAAKVPIQDPEPHLPIETLGGMLSCITETGSRVHTRRG